MTYEELSRAWRVLQKLDRKENTPRFVRQKLLIQGLAVEKYVQMEVQCQVMLPSIDRVAVPLGLAGTILNETPVIEGGAAGGQFVTYDPNLGGYVAWLQGDAGPQRTIRLSVTALLEQDGSQSLLRCNLPRANQSLVQLEVTRAISDPFTSATAKLAVESQPDGDVQLQVQGAVGDFRLGWEEPRAEVVQQQRSVVSVEGNIYTEINGRRVRSEANLSVQSFGGPLERFRVRLPQGATLIPQELGPVPAPRMTPVATDSGDRRQVWLVTLPEPTTESVDVKLVAEQAVGLDPQAEVDLAGFEVLGAVRQYGDVAIRVADDWRLQWGESEMSRRIDIGLLPPSMQRPDLTDAIRYYRQPWKQPVKVSLLGNRIEAVPRYRLELRPEEAILTTSITYRIPGARVAAFSVDLRDWQQLSADPIEPISLVDNDEVAQSKEGELYVPLKNPATRTAQVSFTARRELSPQDETLLFRLPTPRATSQGPSELIVVVDPSLRIAPDPVLSRRLRPAPLKQNEHDRTDPTGLRTFRFRGFLPNQVFAAKKEVRPGELEVSLDSRVTIGETRSQIEQEFAFKALHQPVRELRFRAPTGVSQDQLKLELSVSSEDNLPTPPDAEPSTPRPVNERVSLPFRLSSPSQDAEASPEIIAQLQRPWIGKFHVTMTYDLPIGLEGVGETGDILLSLASVADAVQRTHRAALFRENGKPLALASQQMPWSMAPLETAIQSNQVDTNKSFTTAALRVVVDTPVDGIAVRPVQEQTPAMAGHTLRQALWQTWVSTDKTQQRAIFRFISHAPEVRVAVPPSALRGEVETLLDGQPVAAKQLAENRLEIELPASLGSHHTLELRYFEPMEATSVVSWRPATLVADAEQARSYWQVILPSNRQLIDAPDSFALAMRWGWLQGGWDLKPALDTHQLEEQLKAVHGGSLAMGERAVLLSFLGSPPPSQGQTLTTVDRNTTVLAVCGGVLLVGLAFVYVPALRSKAGCLCLLLGLAAFALLCPGLFWHVSRAGLVGLGIMSIVAVVHLVLQRRELGSSPTAHAADVTSPLSPAAGGTDTMISLPLGAVSTNAPTVSVPPQESNG